MIAQTGAVFPRRRTGSVRNIANPAWLNRKFSWVEKNLLH